MATRHLALTLAACTAATCLTRAHAQAAGTGADGVERIVVTGSSAAPSVSGFAGQPLAQLPLSARVLGEAELAEAGVDTLAGVARLDASVSDAYNAEGYWSFLSVRGFMLDNRSNYRRDGLPLNAETALGLANKQRVEVLKGLSGIQAGVSAPGGLVNLVVKRPTTRVRSASLEAREAGTLASSVDVAQRFGPGQAFGLRVNAHAARLQPPTRRADGQRRLLALAGDWQLTPDSLLEAEVETSSQRQPTVPGFSLRGNALPDADRVDPRVNLNNQPWSLPTVLDGDTASLRWRQRLAADWQFTAHAGTQRLHSDDRVAFPFGCYDAGTDTYYADRYCPDGHLDLYDFRSDNERRRTDALDLQFSGSAVTGPWQHQLSVGLLGTRRTDRFQRQAFNYSGSGRDDGSVVTPAAPELTDENTNRDERSTELYLRDAIRLSPHWSLWAGLRHTQLQRRSVRTDGSRPIDYRQRFTTPWLGLAWRASESTLVYANAGQGVETDVAPNRSRYTNAGQALPALKSRQMEAGVKLGGPQWQAQVSAFRIERPLAADLGACDEDASCTRAIDGEVRHQGLEASLDTRSGPWAVQASGLWLQARRQGARDPALNGLRPTNVPRHTLKARLSHDLAALPGAQLQAALVHEGPRDVLPDNTVQAPAWTRLDLAASLTHTTAGTTWQWRLALDNATDTRAWRETPYQFGHAYLFPLPARAWRASVTAAF